jgi:peptidoglycan/xylan/chitin deacetylase (PgdA/CDA1 family)
MRRGARVNICFHGIGTPGRELEPGEAPYWVSADFFAQLLDHVAADPRVGLSFDDGNASDVDIALPALRARGLRAAFFPVAARIGRPGSVDDAGVRALIDEGMTVGSHGMHHRAWRGLEPADLDEELVAAREIISRAIGAEVSAAACPLGSYDRQVLKRLRTLGYAQVFTSDRASVLPGAWLQPRYSVQNTDTVDDVRSLVERRPRLRQRALALARTTAKRCR